MRAPRLVTENRVLAFIQIALALTGGTFVWAALDSLTELPVLYLVALGFFTAAAVALVTYRIFPARPPQLAARDALLDHRISVLQGQLTKLHTLFVNTRDTKGSAEPSATVFQWQIEPVIKAELGADPEQLERFYDETGFQRVPADDDDAKAAAFLERRIIRLREIVADLRALRQ